MDEPTKARFDILLSDFVKTSEASRSVRRRLEARKRLFESVSRSVSSMGTVPTLGQMEVIAIDVPLDEQEKQQMAEFVMAKQRLQSFCQEQYRRMARASR